MGQLDRRPGRRGVFHPEQRAVSIDLLGFGGLFDLCVFYCGPRHFQRYEQVNSLASSSPFSLRGSIGGWLCTGHEAPSRVLEGQFAL